MPTIKNFLKNKRKEITLLLVSIMISMLIGFFILEFFYFSWKQQQFHDPNTEFNSELGWSPIINRETIGWKNKLIISNSLGFRSKEIDYTKDHVLMVGDSIIWGLVVGNNETSSYHLDNILNDSLQVLNLGVSGYGIDQYYLHTKKYASKLNTKNIIVTIYTGNDIENTGTDESYGKSKPLFEIVDGDLSLINSDINQYSCSNLFSMFWTLSNIDFFRNIKKDICPVTVYDNETTEKIIVLLLEKFDVLSKENNANLIFIISPTLEDYTEKSENLIFFENIFKNANYNYINYYDEIINSTIDPTTLYIAQDAHYSDNGNKLLAETIEKFIFY